MGPVQSESRRLRSYLRDSHRAEGGRERADGRAQTRGRELGAGAGPPRKDRARKDRCELHVMTWGCVTSCARTCPLTRGGALEEFGVWEAAGSKSQDPDSASECAAPCSPVCIYTSLRTAQMCDRVACRFDACGYR